MPEAMLFFKPEEEGKIPNRAGVYAFLYNPFQRSRLGIYKKDESDPRKLKEARDALKIKLSRFESLKNNVTLSGELTSSGAYSNNPKIFSGSLASVNRGSPWEDLDKLNDKCFIEYLEMAEKSFLMFSPLYCGMTVSQGLKSRYFQHKDNYNLEKSGSFGGRLSDSLLSWTDMLFLCAPMTAHSKDRESVRVLEKQLIHMLEPMLSLR